jgi:hypothetical protein
MVEPHDGCMQRAGRQKTASGITVYLQEELGDARLNCVHLTHYIDLARQIVEKSDHRDHIFEVAGHLLQAIPEHLFKLEKSLQAVALAADRLDYEEIKQELRPEKVEDLERVLKEVRIRTIPRRSEPMRPTMNPMQAAEELQKIAANVRTTGKLPLTQVLGLIAGLEDRTRTAEDVTATAEMFETMGKALLQPSKESPKRLHLAATLKKILAENLTASDDSLRDAWVEGTKEAATGSKQDLAREAAPTLRLAQRDLLQGAKELEKFRPSNLGGPWGILSDLQNAMWGMVYWSAVQNTLAHGPSIRFGNDSCGPGMACDPGMAAGPGMELEESPEEEAARRSRFEKGQPADPTQNMSPEDAEEWKKKNEEHKDKFKVASDFTREDQFTVFLDRMVGGVENAAKQMRHSLETYKRDPAKYAPQLGNLYNEAASLQGQLRVLQRAMPKNIVFAAERVAALDPGPMPRMEMIKTDSLVAYRKGVAGNWRMALSMLAGVVENTGALLNELGAGTDGITKATALTREILRARRSLAGGQQPDPRIDLAASDEEYMSRFEEGKPADPTENMSPEDAAKWKKETKDMSPEDAKKWKENTEKHKDKFKAADWKMAANSLEVLREAISEASSFMGIGSELKKRKIKYDFSTGDPPIAPAYYTVNVDGKRYGIVNKRYADKPDFTVGDIAVGKMD